MLKKIIIGGLIVIAILSAIFIWGSLQDRSDPKRPDSLINKDKLSEDKLSEDIDSIFSGLDNNDTNTTEEMSTSMTPNEEMKQKKEQPKDTTYGANGESNDIDDNNNIYTNDYSSQQGNTSEPVAEETNEPQKIDTKPKESLEDIQSKVQKKINNSSSLSGSNIEVSTNDKGIVLSGIVTSAKQKILAGSIANSASENATVINRITVEVPKPVETEKPKDSEAAPVVSPEKSM